MTDIASLLIPDFDLSARNTLALRARSRFGLTVTAPGTLPALFAHAAGEGVPVRVLGGGSNVVLAEDFDGITALVALSGRRIIDESSDHVLVEAAAGETWHNLVAWTVDQGLGGIENLALIPGTAGAAPVQNIGAYGAELADFFLSLDAYDRETSQTVTFDRAACAFAYRDSAFKHAPDRYVVLAIRLALPKAWQPNLRFAGLTDLADTPGLSPRMVMDRVIALRQSKLPDWRVNPNAGSFFQNPILPVADAAPVLAEFPEAPNYPQPDGQTKLSAGWLIEKSGLKGFQMGRVGMSERHALVVVNHGGATQSDVAALAAHVKATVRNRFAVQLHEEPIFL
ncbi:UDP-N-acetylmuramate dehydrogenase [Devosia sediminis]|uniref:UDP-N-acetylenolpyruvoylglucosamine reductase n=1 Tax=Devosia sediminis TaxID=2798801 RepID=A0A934IU02_9HYPH|nr:UDP-N-acetylmuramate dehydrogenase [Devosia sediminis]MBJ3784312.1 UDP-N-acetylmuramate dehydrogenase [Devosia sediminis]